MCYGSPRPQGGARSTDTGPAHEPVVCSLPAAEHARHKQQVYEQIDAGNIKYGFDLSTGEQCRSTGGT